MPRPASIISVSSLKRFSKRVTKPFGKGKKPEPDNDQTEQAIESNKHDERDAKERKFDAKDEEKTKKEEEMKKDAKQVEESEKVDKIVRKVEVENRPTSSKRAAIAHMDHIDEEMEQEVELKGNFANVYALYNNEQWRGIDYDERSFYTPNAIAIFEKLDMALELLGSNLKFQDKNLKFYSQFVKLGVGLAYWLRILQVRDTVSENSYGEDRFYRAFTREIPLSNFVIPGFLEPAFSNIAYFESKDSRIKGYLVPQLEPIFTARNTTNVSRKEDRYYYQINDTNALVQPDIPMLYEFCRRFCDPTTDINVAWNQSHGTFVPRGGAQNANFTIGGMNFHGGAADRVSDEEIRRLSSPGFARPNFESMDRLAYIRRGFLNSGFYTDGPDYTAARNFTNIADFMRMPNGSYNWVNFVLDQLTIFASCFEGEVTLENIATLGSREVPVYTQMTVNQQIGSPNSVTVNADEGRIPWFPNIMRHFRGTLTYYETNYKVHHLWLAMDNPVNSSITVHYNRRTDADNQVDINILHNAALGTRVNTNTSSYIPRYGPYFGLSRNNDAMPHRILGARGSSADNIRLMHRNYQHVRAMYKFTLGR